MSMELDRAIGGCKVEDPAINFVQPVDIPASISRLIVCTSEVQSAHLEV